MYSAWPLMVLDRPGGGLGNAGVPPAFWVLEAGKMPAVRVAPLAVCLVEPWLGTGG